MKIQSSRSKVDTLLLVCSFTTGPFWRGYRTLRAGVCEPEHGALRTAHRSPDSAGHHRHRLRTLHTARHTRETLCIGILKTRDQCCGSMKFWYGSGSADPYLWIMDSDPDPTIFVSDLQDVNRKRKKKKDQKLKKNYCWKKKIKFFLIKTTISYP